MLADFCEERKLFLANSFFKKRLDDRWTWRNDALGLKKEIDYVLLRSMKGVVDVGVLTSVNTGSDHRMLRCKMRLNPISQPVRRPRGFPVIDSDLLCSTAQCLLHENMMTGDTIKDYDTITRVITTATQMSTRYEYLPPRLSPRTRDLLQRRRELRHGDNGRGIVEYAEICKLARKSIQEDLRQRHIQILSVQSLEVRDAFRHDPSPSDEPFPDHVSQSVKAVRNFYNALYHSSFGPPTPPSGQINLQVYNNEVQMAMKRSKARSAAGSDGIQSPSLRALSQILALPITHFSTHDKDKENLIMAIQLLYAHSTAAVRIANQLAEFNLQRGVRQGDSMSPVLFTLVLQYAVI
ncbi:hypothetical protein COOONC_04044 [Cooperia oncophora]